LLGLYADALTRLRASASLRWSLCGWSVTGLLLSEGYALGVVVIAPQHPVALLTGLTGAWWLVIGVVLLGGASMLDAPDGTHLQRYGVPNGLTALRAWFCVPVLLTALIGLPGREGLSLFAGVGGAAGMLDAVDGLLARSIGPVSRLGKALDPFMDTLFFVMAAVGGLALNIVPLWLSALIVVRYAGPVVVTPFVFLARKRPELVHTVWGRRNTILTGVVLFVLFWVLIANGPVFIVSLIIGVPLLVPTLILHFIALLRRVAAAPTAR
jgi:phosphatidylglycerophosphate synthase